MDFSRLQKKLDEPPIAKLLQQIDPSGNQLMVVGGAVRDCLLGRDIGDLDFATTILPRFVIDHVVKAGFGVDLKGIDHGTVVAHRDGNSFEITTLRRDIETDGRHAKVQFGKDWLEDAKRRDFTINALYYHPAVGLQDPLNIIADIQTRTLKFIGCPQTRLMEDGLRFFRFYRFWSQLDDPHIDENSKNAVEACASSLALPTMERITNELLKLLQKQPPHILMNSWRYSGIEQRMFAKSLHDLPTGLSSAPMRLGFLISEEPEYFANHLRLPGSFRRTVIDLGHTIRALRTENREDFVESLLRSCDDAIHWLQQDKHVLGPAQPLLEQLSDAKNIGAVQARDAGLVDGPQMGHWIREQRKKYLLDGYDKKRSAKA